MAGQQMSKFRMKLHIWAAVWLGEMNYDGKRVRGGGRGGNKCLDPESTGKQSDSFSSVWKPGWDPGWHTGALGCATSVVVVLLINVGFTIYVATNPE